MEGEDAFADGIVASVNHFIDHFQQDDLTTRTSDLQRNAFGGRNGVRNTRLRQ